MGSGRRYYARNLVQGGGWTPITDSSFDGFGFLNFYDVQTNSFEIAREAVSQTNMAWDGEFPNETDVDNFISVNPAATYNVETIYAQKKTDTEIILETSAEILEFMHDGFENSKHYLKYRGVGALEINGTLKTSLAKNTPYFSVSMLVKGESTLGAIQPLLFISTAASTGRVRAGIYLNANPSTGCLAYGRRATADSLTTVTSARDCSTWVVITAIWDYINQDLILRTNGAQDNINTSFGNGTNSENTDSLIQRMGETNSTHSFASMVIWNSTPSSISEIEEVENRMMAFANITP